MIIKDLKSPQRVYTSLFNICCFVASIGFSAFFLVACESETNTPSRTVAGSDKAITAFVFTARANEALATDLVAEINGSDITVEAPDSVDVTSLVPEVTYTGKELTPPSGVAQDFTDPATYTVTAEDNSTVAYTVTVTLAAPPSPSDKAITAFVFTARANEALATDLVAEINGSDITVEAPDSVDVTSLVPEVTYTGKELTPPSGVAQDFTDPATYTVTAEDNSTVAYTVTVTLAAPPSPSDKAITAFVFTAEANTALTTDLAAEINGSDITVEAPHTVDVTSLVPEVTYIGKETTPPSGVAQDFTNPVTYTVTAEDNSTVAYTATVTLAAPPSSDKEITAFVFTAEANAALTTDLAAEINGSDITVETPSSVGVTSLVPEVTYTGKELTPLSGIAQDFTDPVTYTVTAEDNSTVAYTVTVNSEAKRQMALYEGMVKHYDAYLNTLSYFPDDPTAMTQADSAKFEDPSFWPAPFYLDDRFTTTSVEVWRRNLNFLRYIIHTRVFAEALKKFIPIDRGRLIDYREVLEVARNVVYARFLLKEDDSRAWIAGLSRDQPDNHVPLDSPIIPNDFDPTFGISDQFNIRVPRRLRDLIGDEATEPDRVWFNYGLHSNSIEVILHEIFHNMSYTHDTVTKEDYNQDYLDKYFPNAKLNDRNDSDNAFAKPVLDVTNVVGVACDRLYSTYFGIRSEAFTFDDYNFNADGVALKDGEKDKGYLFFPMNFYKDPSGAEANNYFQLVSAPPPN